MIVQRLAYEQAVYRLPRECVHGIQEHLNRGWEISDLAGAADGPYLVIFRKPAADGDREPATSGTLTSRRATG